MPSLYASAMETALDNLIKGVRNLSESLSNIASYPTPPQTPPKSHKNASEVAVTVTSPYFTHNITRKRARSSSPPTRRKKSKKSTETGAFTTPTRRRKEGVDALRISVTSPYFPSTPNSSAVPSTPARRRKREKRTVASPYFAASAQAMDDVDLSTSQRGRKRTKTVIEEPIIPVIDPPELWWETEALPVKDPISFVHFRAHSLLYYQLWLAKPILIQGA